MNQALNSLNFNPSGIIDPIIDVREPIDLKNHSFYLMILLVTNKLNGYNDDVINNVVKPLDDIRKIIDDMNDIQNIINKIKQSQTKPDKDGKMPDPSPEDKLNAKNFANAMARLKKDVDKFNSDYPDKEKINPEFRELAKKCTSVYNMIYDEKQDIDPAYNIGSIIDNINTCPPGELDKFEKVLAQNLNVWTCVSRGDFDTTKPGWKDYGKAGVHDIFNNWLEVGETQEGCIGMKSFVDLTLTGSEGDLNNQLNEDLKKYDSITSVAQKFVNNIIDMCSFWVNKQSA